MTIREVNLPLDIDHTCRRTYALDGYHYWLSPVVIPETRKEPFCPACQYIRGYLDGEKVKETRP